MAIELKSERLQIVISPSEIRAVDDWRFENRVNNRVPSRSEAIRRLIQLGLQASLKTDSSTGT